MEFLRIRSTNTEYGMKHELEGEVKFHFGPLFYDQNSFAPLRSVSFYFNSEAQQDLHYRFEEHELDDLEEQMAEKVKHAFLKYMKSLRK